MTTGLSQPGPNLEHRNKSDHLAQREFKAWNSYTGVKEVEKPRPEARKGKKKADTRGRTVRSLQLRPQSWGPGREAGWGATQKALGGAAYPHVSTCTVRRAVQLLPQ